MKMFSVYVSPSSQEHNLYANGLGTEEQWANKIADTLIQMLNYNGIRPFRNNTSMDLKAIIQDSDTKKPDIHVAIHTNASKGKARGCEVWVWKEDGTTTNSERLGQLIYNELSPLTPTSDRGLQDGRAAHLGEVFTVKATAVLIEVDFHDNPESAVWITQNVTNIAKAIATGICNYFGIVYREQKQEQVDYKKLYEEQQSENIKLKIQNDSLVALNRELNNKISKVLEVLK
jgi:N-acetylmuramoyl-L-alanine amidase